MKSELFKDLNIGDKVESRDSAGYYIMKYCGTISHISEDKQDAIIHSFDGSFYSTVFARKEGRISEVVKLK